MTTVSTPIADVAGEPSCIACLTPSRTALGYRGTLEGHVAFLVVLGVPMEEAVATVEEFGARPVDIDSERPARWDQVYGVCGRCAQAIAGMPEPTSGDTIPFITTAHDHPFGNDGIH